MMRTLNFAFVLLTGIVCIAVYRVAEEARVAHAGLVMTERQIAREQQTLVVLGAEWASVTQPQRIQALAERHLDLTDTPTLELSSLTLLPHRGDAPLTEGPLRDARAIQPEPTPALPPALSPGIRRIALRTGA